MADAREVLARLAHRGDGDGEERSDDWFASTHEALLDDWARRRATGQGPAITGEDGLAAQRVVEAVYESSRSGNRVALA